VTDSVLARSFDAWAADYDRFRPGYPAALFTTVARALQLPARPAVADLGAGTGRASLAMAELGWRVTAVEPGAAMLEVLAARASALGLDVATREARAEATALPVAAFDAAVAAQAFHWFDKDAALTEMARITTPAGGIALFWNTRDDDASPLLRGLTELLLERTSGAGWWRDRERQMTETRQAIEAHSDFASPQLHELRHVERVTGEQFVGMAFTASQVRALPDAERRRFRDDLTGLLARHGHDQQQTIDVPYRLDLFTARRSGR
jgi:SAM-dependent methyltransferase